MKKLLVLGALMVGLVSVATAQSVDYTVKTVRNPRELTTKLNADMTAIDGRLDAYAGSGTKTNTVVASTAVVLQTNTVVSAFTFSYVTNTITDTNGAALATITNCVGITVTSGSVTNARSVTTASTNLITIAP